MLEQKLEQLANAIKPKSKEVQYLKGTKKEKKMYGSMRSKPTKSKAMKKQAATAMSMKKAKKKPKKKM